jgi:hypothetical protein
MGCVRDSSICPVPTRNPDKWAMVLVVSPVELMTPHELGWDQLSRSVADNLKEASQQTC